MDDGKVFTSQKELLSHLVSGGKVRRRYESINPMIVFLNSAGNLESSLGEKVSYIADFSKWVVHSPQFAVKVIAYKKVDNRYQCNSSARFRMRELGIAVRGLGQVVFTTEGSPGHEALEESSEYARAEYLDPVMAK